MSKIVAFIPLEEIPTICEGCPAYYYDNSYGMEHYCQATGHKVKPLASPPQDCPIITSKEKEQLS